MSSRERDWTAYVFRWFVFSLLIPALGIFIRWLVSFVQRGPAYVNLTDMLRESEVAFLAAIMLAETLGEAPDIGREHLGLGALSVARGSLLALLVLSLLLFAALVPMTSGSSTWLAEEGRTFHMWLNTIIFVISALTCLAARWIYWICSYDANGMGYSLNSFDLETDQS